MHVSDVFQKGKIRLKRRLTPLFVSYLAKLFSVFFPFTLWTYVYTSSGRTSKRPQDVRAYTLWTYGQAIYGRTSKPKRGKFICLNGCLELSENRLFVHEGIFGRFYRLLRGYREIKMEVKTAL